VSGNIDKTLQWDFARGDRRVSFQPGRCRAERGRLGVVESDDKGLRFSPAAGGKLNRNRRRAER